MEVGGRLLLNSLEFYIRLDHFLLQSARSGPDVSDGAHLRDGIMAHDSDHSECFYLTGSPFHGTSIQQNTHLLRVNHPNYDIFQCLCGVDGATVSADG